MHSRPSRQLVGSLIACRDGTVLGEVRDVLFDHASRTIAALCLSSLDRARPAPLVVPFEVVFTCRRGVIQVSGASDVVHISRLPRLEALRARHVGACGATLDLAPCWPQAIVLDLYVDLDSGQVVSVLVARNALPDAHLLILPATLVECLDGAFRLTPNATTGLTDLLHHDTPGVSTVTPSRRGGAPWLL